MPDKNIDVPGQGIVAFPDTMSDDDIANAIKTKLSTTKQPLSEFLPNVASGFVEGLSPLVHPIDAVEGLYHLVTNPKEELVDPAKAAYARAKQSFGHNDYATALGHLSGAIPLIGNITEPLTTGTASESEHALGNILALGVGGMMVDKAIESTPRVIGAVKRVAPNIIPAIKSGAGAGIGDVSVGVGKIGAGALASEMLPSGPLKYALGAAPAYAGARQVMRGLGKGGKAFSDRLGQVEPPKLIVDTSRAPVKTVTEAGQATEELPLEDQATELLKKYNEIKEKINKVNEITRGSEVEESMPGSEMLSPVNSPVFTIPKQEVTPKSPVGQLSPGVTIEGIPHVKLQNELERPFKEPGTPLTDSEIEEIQKPARTVKEIQLAKHLIGTKVDLDKIPMTLQYRKAISKEAGLKYHASERTLKAAIKRAKTIKSSSAAFATN